MEQQFDAGKLGMWLFLATEVLFFGGLFAAYVVLRARNPEVFSYASQYLDTMMGGINTCVLIASSLDDGPRGALRPEGKKVGPGDLPLAHDGRARSASWSSSTSSTPTSSTRT